MLESIRRGQRWLTLFFVGAIGIVFAAFVGLGGPMSAGNAADAVVQVDGRSLGIREFARVRAQQEQSFRDAVGDQFDAATAASFLDARALQTLVDGAVLAQAATELGLRVSAEEVRRAVRGFTGFRDADGQLDKDSVVAFVEYEYGSQHNFAEALKEDLLRRKLGQLLYSQARVSDAEAEAAARYRLEQAQIAYVALDTEALPAGETLSAEEVEAYAAAHEDELRTRYAERRDDFATPEKVRARHILFALPQGAPDSDVSAARERAEQALARLAEGASFEELAGEVSEDLGTRQQGGDLGFFGRGETTAVLEQTAFGLEPGGTSEIVRSGAGFHIVRLEERAEARVRPYAEVAEELAREAAERAAAAKRAETLSEALAEAIRGGASLEASARERDLTLERTGALHRRADGFIPGLGAAPEVLTAAFALTDEQPGSARVFPVGSKLVLFERRDGPDIDEAEVAEAAAAEKQRLIEVERNRMVQDWIDRRREVLTREQRLHVNASLVLDQ